MKEDAPFETVTKLEAAERQLRVAIRMFFECKDMIAVHVLAVGAQEIFSKLGKKHGFKGMWESIDSLPPENKKVLVDHLRKAQNFFKHASRDPEEKLDFDYEDTRFVLFDGVGLCHALIGRFSPEMTMYLGWFASKYPAMLRLTPLREILIDSTSKINFENFENVLQFLDKRNTEGQHKVNMT